MLAALAGYGTRLPKTAFAVWWIIVLSAPKICTVKHLHIEQDETHCEWVSSFSIWRCLTVQLFGAGRTIIHQTAKAVLGSRVLYPASAASMPGSSVGYFTMHYCGLFWRWRFLMFMLWYKVSACNDIILKVLFFLSHIWVILCQCPLNPHVGQWAI